MAELFFLPVPGCLQKVVFRLTVDMEEYGMNTGGRNMPVRQLSTRILKKVLKFHELRRQAVLRCKPHVGHHIIAKVQERHPHQVTVITQNIDGMHQWAKTKNVIELHGSLWRLRCPIHGVTVDVGKTYKSYVCEKCSHWLRPEITWFNDMLDQIVISRALACISRCDLFIGIGTSGVVWPAAGYPQIAKGNGARCIEINPEPSEMSDVYDATMRKPASEALANLFAL